MRTLMNVKELQNSIKHKGKTLLSWLLIKLMDSLAPQCFLYQTQTPSPFFNWTPLYEVLLQIPHVDSAPTKLFSQYFFPHHSLLLPTFMFLCILFLVSSQPFFSPPLTASLCLLKQVPEGPPPDLSSYSK